MGTDNKDFTAQILFTILAKTGPEMTFTTTNFFLTEFLEDSVNAAEIIVGMTVNEMDMHNFRNLLTINNHNPFCISCKDSKKD